MTQAGTFLAGGGELDLQGACLQRFCVLAGSSAARIVVLPVASELPTGGTEYPEAFAAWGCHNVLVAPLRKQPLIINAELLHALETATGIFLTGGNQLKLTSHINHTPLRTALHAAHQRGAVIGGTSAGASALSTYMIADGQSGLMPRYGMVQLSPGLGLLDQLIIDQHFGARQRLGRLLLAVSLSPDLLGIGIDEDTAVEITPDGLLQVLGTGSVMLLDGRHSTHNTVHQLQAAQRLTFGNLCLHVLTEGWRYDPAQHTLHEPGSV